MHGKDNRVVTRLIKSIKLFYYLMFKKFFEMESSLRKDWFHSGQHFLGRIYFLPSPARMTYPVMF